jgi:phage tail-like protein
MANPGGRVDPYANFNFLVEIDGVTQAGFQEVSGLGAEVSVIEYREGADKTNTVRKLPGLIRYSSIVLKRGFTQDRSLWNWFKRVLDGTVQRSSGTITLVDSARNPVLRWNFREGWPSKWEGPALNGKCNEIAIETLVIEHEGLELAD